MRSVVPNDGDRLRSGTPPSGTANPRSSAGSLLRLGGFAARFVLRFVLRASLALSV